MAGPFPCEWKERKRWQYIVTTTTRDGRAGRRMAGAAGVSVEKDLAGVCVAPAEKELARRGRGLNSAKLL